MADAAPAADAATRRHGPADAARVRRQAAAKTAAALEVTGQYRLAIALRADQAAGSFLGRRRPASGHERRDETCGDQPGAPPHPTDAVVASSHADTSSRARICPRAEVSGITARVATAATDQAQRHPLLCPAGHAWPIPTGAQCRSLAVVILGLGRGPSGRHARSLRSAPPTLPLWLSAAPEPCSRASASRRYARACSARRRSPTPASPPPRCR